MFRIIILQICLLLQVLHYSSQAPQRTLLLQLNPTYVRAMAAYKRLEPKLSRSELRAITTIGILNGAMQAEKEMEKHLTEIVMDLILNSNMSDRAGVMPKIEVIEKQISRDQKAAKILSTIMDLATNAVSVQDYREKMKTTLLEYEQLALLQMNSNTDVNITERMASLRSSILKHVTTMKEMISYKIENTLGYVLDEAKSDGFLARARSKLLHKRHSNNDMSARGNDILESVLMEDNFQDNLVVDLERRQDASIQENISPEVVSLNDTLIEGGDTMNSTSNEPAKQQDAGSSESIEIPDMPGGIVGLIASLSGGEGGSDVGALIGALTGVVSNLFGPGGLDVESLISTATSLISGLLSGDKNFGTILGQYVGLAFDGFSGGGGAINNGEFIGNFLGTVVASLSADPEEDDVPPKPAVFIRSLLDTFVVAKNRRGSGETDDNAGTADPHHQNGDGGGSDSFGFIKQIVSSVVGGVVSIILNASLGSSAGSSQGSSTLFGGSSKPMNPHPHMPWQ